MGSLRYQAEDLLRGKLVEEAGWYPLQIMSNKEEPADGDGSTNVIVQFKILADGPYKGVPVQRYYNEKAPGFGRDLFEAGGIELAKEGGVMNYDLLNGKVVDGFIEPRKDNKGNMQNNVARFRPHVTPSA